MTRTDFELIAMVIRETEIGPAAKAAIANAFCSHLRAINPRFDANRFKLAAGTHPLTAAKPRAA